MAQTAQEYKDDLLRTLTSDAFIADREASYYTRELPYAETDAIRTALQSKADVATNRAAMARALATAMEDVE